MNIAIIGAGFTGLAAGYRLAKNGHTVTIFEKDSEPGGLAIGYQEKNWAWSLEKHYHHWFTNDHFILDLAKEVNYPVIIKTPQTNWYVNGKIYQFVSLQAALAFPLLSPLERLRQLFALGLLRINPFWKPLERFKTNDIMPKLMGKKAYEMLWQSILNNKFGKYANDISLAWFWARIATRTQSLAYPEKGFLHFSKHLAHEITKLGGTIHFNTSVEAIEGKNDKIQLGKYGVFDKVLVTLPSFAFVKLTPKLPETYKKQVTNLKGLGAINLVLRLKKPFFTNNTYWLSVADKTSPVMAIVEHTNFMNPKHYDNEHIIYVGNYKSIDDPLFKKTKEELLKLYDPFLKKINPLYKKTLIDYEVFRAPFAQPIIPINYSKMVPSLKTPLANVYLANMQQVYPWDRGTNYAVELGEKVVRLIQADCA